MSDTVVKCDSCRNCAKSTYFSDYAGCHLRYWCTPFGMWVDGQEDCPHHLPHTRPHKRIEGTINLGGGNDG